MTAIGGNLEGRGIKQKLKGFMDVDHHVEIVGGGGIGG